MGTSEIASSIIIAMLNNKLLHTPEDIAEAYKVIYKTIVSPYKEEQE